MDVKRLIDAIVRQTTLLIAQLATSSGMRAPLAQIANQTFLSLASELENQGITQKVAADMFGLALRSYQQKVQRLSESATDRGTTLWEAVFTYLRKKNVVTRADILNRFRHDSERSVRGILNDLVESGLVYHSGQGAGSLYRITSDEDLARAGDLDPTASACALVWMVIFRNSPISAAALREAVGLDDSVLSQAIDALISDGRIRRDNTGETIQYRSDSCLIAVGDAAGWETAIFDHFQTVVTAICAKIRNGNTRSLPDDSIGGSTFSFDIWNGHPDQAEVNNLLTEHRQRISSLWNRVERYNEEHRQPRGARRRVNFYFGQSVQDETDFDIE